MTHFWDKLLVKNFDKNCGVATKPTNYSPTITLILITMSTQRRSFANSSEENAKQVSSKQAKQSEIRQKEKTKKTT